MAEGSIPVEILCSYAHEDETWLRKLENHVRLLQRQELISLWHDRLIVPGTDWAKSIDTHLETASIILLLVSAAFLASDYCYGVEMKRALERHTAGEALVVPILVRPVDWQSAPFAHLQALPTNAKPIATWQKYDTALANIAASLRRIIVEELPLLSTSAYHTHLPTTVSNSDLTNALQKEQELAGRLNQESGRLTLTLDQAGNSLDSDAITQGQKSIPDLFKGSSMPLLVERDEVDKIIGTFEKRLASAKHDISVSGNDCAFVVSHSGLLERALEHQVKVKIICVDPQKKATVKMLTLIDPRFESEEYFISQMKANEQKFHYLRDKYYPYFEFRYLPILPAMGFFVADRDEPTGIIKIEMYTAKPWSPVSTRPHLILTSEMHVWREYFLHQWDNYWNLSREPN